MNSNSKNEQELEKIENLAKACGEDGQRIIEKGLLLIKAELLKKVNDVAFEQKDSNSGLNVNFQNKLRVIRKTLGYEQKEMAQILKTSQPSYSRLEVNQDISVSNLQILFNFLNVSPLWFFYDIGPIFFNGFKEEDNES